jgi:CTD small phosphatase-like protein 2
LKEAAKYFEIVIFTAADKLYADKAIELLDPEKKLIKHRLYRNSCMSFNPLLVKDLNILGRDLSKTLIIDNNPSSFAFQVQ